MPNTPYNKTVEDLQTLQSVADGLGANPPYTGLNYSYKEGLVRDDNTIISISATSVPVTDNIVNYIEVDPSTGFVTSNTTGFTTAQIPLAEVTALGGVITTVIDRRTTLFASASGGGGGSVTMLWTTSGATTTTGVVNYPVPVVAQGKATLLAGDGFSFYKNYTLNAIKTQLTFDSVGDVPPTGTPLEFLYSNAAVGAATGVTYVAWTTNNATTTAGILTYPVAPAAQGKLGLYAGNGQIFYDPSTYVFDLNKTQITFNTVNDIPPTGSKLEFLFSDTALAAGTALSNANPLANGVASSGASSDVSRADHVHPTTMGSALFWMSI